MEVKKKKPERSCIACQNKQVKGSFIRIVRTPEGEVQIDPSGKTSGRGAYICSNANCIDLVIKNKRLDKVLRTKVSSDIYHALRQRVELHNEE